MPQDEPASLTAQAYVDIISFILSGNNMSAGERELPADMESLKQIKFTAGPQDYSARNAAVGSTRVARHAGTVHATTATPSSSAITAPSVAGSVAVTPNSRL